MFMESGLLHDVKDVFWTYLITDADDSRGRTVFSSLKLNTAVNDILLQFLPHNAL